MKEGRITADESKAITIIRMVAMVLIVLCHYVDFFEGLEPLSQLFNVGVPIFFIISGFLYGQKDVKNVLPWYKKQCIKIVIPLYCYYIISALLLQVLGKFGTFNVIDAIKLALNLQGIAGGSLGNVQTGHLWFITFILICYFITPFLQKLRSRFTLKKVFGVLSITSLIWAFIVINVNTKYFIAWMPGMFSYVFAYYFGYYWSRGKKRLLYALTTLAMGLSLGLRLGTKFFIDSGNADIERIYQCVIAPYTHCVLGFWIFFTLYFWCNRFTKQRDFIIKRFKIFDTYSFYIYIVHYMFIEGVLSVSLLADNKVLITVLFITFTVIYSVMLKLIADYLSKAVKNKQHISFKADS